MAQYCYFMENTTTAFARRRTRAASTACATTSSGAGRAYLTARGGEAAQPGPMGEAEKYFVLTDGQPVEAHLQAIKFVQQAVGPAGTRRRTRHRKLEEYNLFEMSSRSAAT